MLALVGKASERVQRPENTQKMLREIAMEGSTLVEITEKSRKQNQK